MMQIWCVWQNPSTNRGRHRLCRTGCEKRFDQDPGSQVCEQDGKGCKDCSGGMGKLEVVGCNRIWIQLHAPQVFFMERCLNYKALWNNALLSRMLNKSARHALLCCNWALCLNTQLYSAESGSSLSSWTCDRNASLIALHGSGFIWFWQRHSLWLHLDRRGLT